MKYAGLVVVILFGLVLAYSIKEVPPYGALDSPASLHVSPFYIEKSMDHTATPNVVTSVLADYRGYDTLGEATVIFTAGICALLILLGVRE
jgi:multicomponent Na+:H+ antiporter subunit B